MDVFLSYARDDADAVGQLHRRRRTSPPLAWFDRELSGGQVWWDEILTQIRSCSLFVIALSPASVGAPVGQSSPMP